jgi:hypothetical protein
LKLKWDEGKENEMYPQLLERGMDFLKGCEITGYTFSQGDLYPLTHLFRRKKKYFVDIGVLTF